VGGPAESGDGLEWNSTYRGDSFICAAALHAGIFDDKSGGCAVATLTGTQSSYISTTRNGISSTAFDSTFPVSFSFVKGATDKCTDLRWQILAVSATFTAIISLFTTSPAVFFASIFTGIYFHVGLASDPPFQADYYSVLSVILASFLPACFVAFVLFEYAIKRTLTGLTAQVEKTILWVGACWVGALTNYTFDFIPIQRLTPHDLDQQPGAKAALTIIVIVVLAIVLGQAWCFRQEGRMRRYLALYGLFGVVLLLMAAIPGLSLRIHHYILGMLLIPGTCMQTRFSLVYQGLLVGFFIDGTARWGFASILQTPGELLGTGQTGSALPALLALPLITAANITFSWTAPPSPFDGASVLVNDVERFRQYDSRSTSFTFDAGSDISEDTTQDVPVPDKYYFRFGFLEGNVPGDYTQAGTWHVKSGTWTPMAHGPSRRKRKFL
jgi:hypothetical protein